MVYGVYETTNYSIINKWEMTAVIMDTLWGGVLFAATTGIVYRLRHTFSHKRYFLEKSITKKTATLQHNHLFVSDTKTGI